VICLVECSEILCGTSGQVPSHREISDDFRETMDEVAKLVHRTYVRGIENAADPAEKVIRKFVVGTVIENKVLHPD
jgi:hypothetical protein